jgi:hypothetical protein
VKSLGSAHHPWCITWEGVGDGRTGRKDLRMLELDFWIQGEGRSEKRACFAHAVRRTAARAGVP